MREETGTDPLGRLRGLLSGAVAVDPAALPRVIGALVRSIGAEAELAFGLQLVREPRSERAAALAAMSPDFLGSKAVAYLKSGATKWKGHTSRLLATVEALGRIGGAESHSALCAIAEEAANAEVRRTATVCRQGIEYRNPTRYWFLPLLLTLDAESPDKGEQLVLQLRDVEDKELVPVLLGAWGDFSLAAKKVALRSLEVRGDSLAGHTFQGFLEEGDVGELLVPVCACLAGILARHPQAVQGYERLWRRLWSKHSHLPEVARAAALALTVDPCRERTPLYREFLRSPVEAVRLSGLCALITVPSPDARPELLSCLCAESEEERTAALEAFIALGDGGVVDEWAQSRDPLQRRGVAGVCLKGLRSDVWVTLAADPDPTVAETALQSWDKVPPEARPTSRQVEPLLDRLTARPSFRKVCRILASVGDQQTVGVAASQLRKEAWKRVHAANVLKALRIRRVFRWNDLPEEQASEILQVIEEHDGGEMLSLLGSLVDDLPASELTRFATVLNGRAQGNDDMVRAVLCKVQEAAEREQARGEFSYWVGQRNGPTLPAVRRLVELWAHMSRELGQERCAQIEQFLCSVAGDRTAAPPERVEALVALGDLGSAQVLPTLSELRSATLESLKNAAEGALEALGRRIPAAVLRQGPTLLLVCADRNTHEPCQRFLGERGVHVLVAPNAPSALRILDRWKLHVVIVDLDTAGGGEAVLQRTVRFPGGAPVLVVSGRTDRATVLRIKALGATDVVRKPLDLGELFTRIRRAVEPREGVAQVVEASRTATPNRWGTAVLSKSASPEMRPARVKQPEWVEQTA